MIAIQADLNHYVLTNGIGHGGTYSGGLVNLPINGSTILIDQYDRDIAMPANYRCHDAARKQPPET